MPRYCSFCGAKLREDGNFCEGCGRKTVSERDWKKEIEEEKKNRYTGYFSWEKHKGTYIMIFAAAILISIIFILLFLLACGIEFNDIHSFHSNITTKTGFPLNIFTIRDVGTSNSLLSGVETDFLALIIDFIFFTVILSIIFFAVDLIYYKIKSRKI